MTRGLKVTLALGGIVVLGYVGASWYAGQIAQQAIVSWVDQTNQDIQRQWTAPETPPELQVDDYQRGVFSSQARYIFKFTDQDGQAQSLAVEQALQHGPWPLEALKNGIWQPLAAYSHLQPLPDGAWQPWFDVVADHQVPWQATVQVGFQGQASGVWTLQPVKTIGELALDFSGGVLRADYTPKQRQTTVTAEAQSLKIQDDSGLLHFEDLQFQALTTLSGETDMQSHQTLQASQVRIQQEGAPDLLLHQPAMLLDLARTGSLLDGRVRYDVEQLSAGKQNLGTLQLQASAQQLNVEAVQALMALLAQQQAQDDDGAPLTPQQEQQVREALLPVLAASPRLALDAVTWKTDKGQTDFKAVAQFRPVPQDADPDLGRTIESAIARVSAHAGVSRPMLMQILRDTQASSSDGDMAVALIGMLFDRYSGRLRRAELLREQDGQLQVDISYADGVVTINDREMTPPELSGRLSAALGE